MEKFNNLKTIDEHEIQSVFKDSLKSEKGN